MRLADDFRHPCEFNARLYKSKREPWLSLLVVDGMGETWAFRYPTIELERLAEAFDWLHNDPDCPLTLGLLGPIFDGVFDATRAEVVCERRRLTKGDPKP